MHIVVLGNTKELLVFSDLMEKAGGKVDHIPSPSLSDLRRQNSPVDAFAISSETLPKKLMAALADITDQPPALVCDITDGTDPLSKDPSPQPEHLLQSATGLAQITGFPETPPTLSKVPFVAVSSALYAASMVLAVLQGESRKKNQRVTVSRYLTAINALTTFLPAALRGANPTPIGNQHPSSSPWNTYPTKDGWVLICTSKDAQWAKLRDAIGSDAVQDSQFDLHADRISKRTELDAIIAAWTKTFRTNACVEILLQAGIPAGPILGIDTIFDDPNLKARQPNMTPEKLEPGNPEHPLKSLSLFRITALGAKARPASSAPVSGIADGAKPLAGLRVIELGQFTTAPLACRHLAHLGADVLKVESPGGEPSRQWKPIIDGQGHFFTITNTGKRFVELNLRDPDQLDQLKSDIRKADLIVENMRPDVMGKLGLGHAELAKLNPDLTVCSISGFGAFGAYPGRAAYDTIIQGMSGIMDLTRSSGMPTKLGISAADILGAQVALFAILSTLRQNGQFIDISMQDVAVYAALLGRKEGLSDQDVMAALAHGHSVQEIAQSDIIARDILMTILDQNGVERLAPSLPYRVH